jgi:hypothetical protein
MLSSGFASTRLRPRPGWGVTLKPLALVVSRPFTSTELAVPWSAVSVARSQGGSRVVVLKSGQRVRVSRFLFAGAEPLKTLLEAVQERSGLGSLDS